MGEAWTVCIFKGEELGEKEGVVFLVFGKSFSIATKFHK